MAVDYPTNACFGCDGECRDKARLHREHRPHAPALATKHANSDLAMVDAESNVRATGEDLEIQRLRGSRIQFCLV
jgi:hypothetical protein